MNAWLMIYNWQNNPYTEEKKWKNEFAREFIKSLSAISIVILLRHKSETGSVFQSNVPHAFYIWPRLRGGKRSMLATCEVSRLKAELINSRACVIHSMCAPVILFVSSPHLLLHWWSQRTKQIDHPFYSISWYCTRKFPFIGLQLKKMLLRTRLTM